MKFLNRIDDNSIEGNRMSNVKCQMLNDLKAARKPRSLSARLAGGFAGFRAIFAVSCLLLAVSSPVFAADNLVVVDPMYIGVGARPLGMGKAYVAVAEDGDALFINPAGLGKATTPKLTSMYTNLLGDVNYMVLGGVYPQTQNSAIGAGAVISSISGIDLRDSSGASSGTGSWGNSVFFLSYGVNLEESNLQLGGSFKYFSQGGAGAATIESASASGMGFDLGAVYSPSENLSLGVSAQNPIGTKMQSSNRIENTIPSLFKVGGSLKLKPAESQKLIIAADMDLARGAQSAMHAGAEYQATPNISLRAGLDQNPVAGGVETNPTMGIGITSGGMQFNYAFHPYGAIAENTTHYFSVSYVGVPKQAAAEEASLNITLKEPSDKAVVYADAVKVSGLAKGAAVVTVNGANVLVEKDGSFTASVPISKIGKKLVLVEAKNAQGKSVQEARRVLRLLNFADVPDGHWAKQPIEGSSTAGLVQGYPDGTFKPERVLTRAEIATLLVRAKGKELTERPASSVFKDVKGDFWAAAYIKEAVDMGLVKGYPDGKFRPNKRLTKAEAITVLVRYDKLPVSVAMENPYRDVKAKHWAAKYVQAAKDNGMLSYIEGDKLGLGNAVSRAESVEMMSKTTVAGKLIKDLLSFEKGYEYEKSAPIIKASIN
ncbi:S-layer homology domain-containing protein [Candidatus Saganbacteria bacterium]|nr:S-layer homology domain-containing protein [Candidatus Saganbacteria bacterium]